MDIKITVHDFGVSEHFKLWELCHQSGKEIYIDKEFIFNFVPALEEFRQWYNRPINVTSGYRPPQYNASVGGSKNSAHLYSRAIDFPLPAEFYDMKKARQEQFLKNVKKKWVQCCHKRKRFAQVNFYDNRLHLGMALTRDNFLDLRKAKK